MDIFRKLIGTVADAVAPDSKFAKAVSVVDDAFDKTSILDPIIYVVDKIKGISENKIHVANKTSNNIYVLVTDNIDWEAVEFAASTIAILNHYQDYGTIICNT